MASVIFSIATNRYLKSVSHDFPVDHGFPAYLGSVTPIDHYMKKDFFGNTAESLEVVSSTFRPL